MESPVAADWGGWELQQYLPDHCMPIAFQSRAGSGSRVGLNFSPFIVHLSGTNGEIFTCIIFCTSFLVWLLYVMLWHDSCSSQVKQEKCYREWHRKAEQILSRSCFPRNEVCRQRLFFVTKPWQFAVCFFLPPTNRKQKERLEWY